MQWLDIIFKLLQKIFKSNSFNKKYRVVNSKKLKSIINNKNWQVVDLRNNVEYEEHHLINTTNIPYWTFNFNYFKKIDKNKKILLISNDYRSNLNIYKNLKRKGFKVRLLNIGYKNIRNHPFYDDYTKVIVY
ncbi:rhodanese-like domain-containing protein [Spiroplasma turonicum]|uniref:Rhodanese domain-containing protein n=1 Tax=Spiroplasma turonicum TaxID=216946 RepID=A0A0K1P4U8_9MOLU|nr:rhodanese-like domain-containing protein [Spiroplasma turonicum]AKU79316.1 hypothetical protein STURON_0070 [Spiroplasma turonicum]ALX70339.1 hypothetical protein STURO_v1c00700 [Spiroplasma turonicum]